MIILSIPHRLPIAKQTEAFLVAYKVFTDEQSFPKEIRRQAIERVCVPLMRLCNTQALTEFFKTNIKDIVTMIEAKTIKVRNQSNWRSFGWGKEKWKLICKLIKNYVPSLFAKNCNLLFFSATFFYHFGPMSAPPPPPTRTCIKWFDACRVVYLTHKSDYNLHPILFFFRKRIYPFEEKKWKQNQYTKTWLFADISQSFLYK